MTTSDETTPRPRTGMVLGKFLPPHRGHVYLCEFAGRFVDRLAIVVGTLADEPIPGKLRYRWMCELFPNAEVVHLDKELPQEPSEHPDFWTLWRESLTEVLPFSPELVFASESYGWRLAEELGASFMPVDESREIVPVSGTAIRNDPMKHWDNLPRPVRPYFVRRVSIFGPESTGKTTLTKRLAERFETVAVPEYARTYLEAHRREPILSDMVHIARGQMASEFALARNANRLLFCDTDPLATTIWSEWLFDEIERTVAEIARRQTYDLTLLLAPDVPWVADDVRYLPEHGEAFFEKCRQVLRAHHRPFVIVDGDWKERQDIATNAVEELLAANEDSLQPHHG